MPNQKSAPSGFPMSCLCILLWKKSNLVFIKAKTKASVQSFCVTLELSPLEPTSHQPLARSTWLLQREGKNKRGQVLLGKEKGFVSWDIISGLGRTRHFFKLTNQLFKLSWASDGSTSSPMYLFSSQVRLTGLCGRHSGSHCACALLPPIVCMGGLGRLKSWFFVPVWEREG